VTDIKIEKVEVVKQPLCRLKGRWTIETRKELMIEHGMRTRWQKINTWLHVLVGLPDPYCHIMHGLDLEEELIAALTKEINDVK
jgi:hypothetical protein